MAKFLMTPMSQFSIPGPTMVLRPSVPKAPASGWEYAAVLNHWLSFLCGPEYGFPTLLARWLNASSRPSRSLPRMENGKPFWKVAIPVTCQPPTDNIGCLVHAARIFLAAAKG